MKTIEDATAIRRRILAAFEHAEREIDETERAKFLTFVIIGGGPTGVELAGTIAELARDTLRKDFRNFDTRDVRVVLIEAGPRILSGFPESLSAYALRALTNLGVEIKLGQAVSKCMAGGVEIDRQYLPAKTIVWAAGVAASPAAEWLHAPADRAGRILVQPDLTVPGHANIFAIGDTAHVETVILSWLWIYFTVLGLIEKAVGLGTGPLISAVIVLCDVVVAVRLLNEAIDTQVSTASRGGAQRSPINSEPAPARS